MAPRTRGGKSGSSAAAPAEPRLWAPWRYGYLRSAIAGPKRCIFCFGKLTESGRVKRLVLFENQHAIAMLNRYPYNNGHVMVAPRRHLASPELFTRTERIAVNELLTASVEIVRRTLHPHGINLGANLGRSAGAGFAAHLHWHVVPRWDGDTNFMPVLASTRVLSQSLKDSFRQLRRGFKAAGADLPKS